MLQKTQVPLHKRVPHHLRIVLVVPSFPLVVGRSAWDEQIHRYPPPLPRSVPYAVSVDVKPNSPFGNALETLHAGVGGGGGGGGRKKEIKKQTPP